MGDMNCPTPDSSSDLSVRLSENGGTYLMAIKRVRLAFGTHEQWNLQDCEDAVYSKQDIRVDNLAP